MRNFLLTEIIRAAGTENPQELTDLLHETSTQDITASCFDDALLEACHRGNFEAACMLLVAGAKKVKESICISIRNGHYRISSLLMVCYATLQGDVDALEMLLDKSLEKYEWFQQFVDESVPLQTVVESIRLVLNSHLKLWGSQCLVQKVLSLRQNSHQHSFVQAMKRVAMACSSDWSAGAGSTKGGFFI